MSGQLALERKKAILQSEKLSREGTLQGKYECDKHLLVSAGRHGAQQPQKVANLSQLYLSEVPKRWPEISRE